MARDVRATIEAGLSAPGGKLWGMNEYLLLAQHRIHKYNPIRNRNARSQRRNRRLHAA
jgi:hypothetical protein